MTPTCAWSLWARLQMTSAVLTRHKVSEWQGVLKLIFSYTSQPNHRLSDILRQIRPSVHPAHVNPIYITMTVYSHHDFHAIKVHSSGTNSLNAIGAGIKKGQYIRQHRASQNAWTLQDCSFSWHFKFGTSCVRIDFIMGKTSGYGRPRGIV